MGEPGVVPKPVEQKTFLERRREVHQGVEDGQRTNMRGDLLPITPGLDVRAVNTAGSLERDRLRITEWFSKMLPVGFYYKAFHTPTQSITPLS